MDLEDDAVLSRLREEKEACLDAARPDAVQKQRKRNSLTARERIALLADPGSFIEYGMLARPADESLQGPADAIVTGIGRIDGKPVAIVSYDYTVLGGTQGVRGHAKQFRIFSIAQQMQCPILVLSEGGGARAQELALYGGGGGENDFTVLARLSGKVPLVCLVLGRAFAGHANLAGLCDVIIARRSACMGISGPPLVFAATGKTLTPEEIGSAEMHAGVGGIDVLVDTDEEAIQAARKYLSFFTHPEIADSGEAVPQEQMRTLVPANLRRAYDVRKVVAGLADKDSVFELRGDWAQNVVTALIRLSGRSIGVIANQSKVLAGTIDANGSDKIARFATLCDRFGISLLFLVDTPGFYIGPAAEAQAMVRHSSRILLALGQVTVPIATVILRKAYGLAYMAMGSSVWRPLMVAAWPTAEFGGMGLEGAAEILKGKSDVESGDYVRDMKDHGSAMNLAYRFFLDDVIDPVETRQLLIETYRNAPPRDESLRSRGPIDSW